jgi:hypothetical protein
MSTVTEAVRDYILPWLIKAESVVAEAEQASGARPDYIGFDLALQVIRRCKDQVANELTRDAAVVLSLLDTSRDTLALTTRGAATRSALEASKYLDKAAVILRAPGEAKI